MTDTDNIKIGPPKSQDGYALNCLVQANPPLDTNSVYCNLLQCTHFHDTCIAAKREGELIGFISGYCLPARPSTLFVWQVVVAEAARGKGLATRMLHALLDRPACREVDTVETTITASNAPSQALFTKFAATLGAPVEWLDGFDENDHFHGHHETERLWRIGPIPKTQTRLLI